ncbi:M24 family metallopeptidase [Methanocaldococcus indicus]|uniref:M24 family metallopeptidase n=1 Tax=Methanocaldococcus indicus TaxID=213231 RepID=UPI003C6D18BC
MDRCEKFIKYMEEENIKKAVILKKENINYFLGRYFPSFGVLVFEDKPYLYVGKLNKDLAETYNIEVREFKDWKDIFKDVDGVEEELPIKFLKYLNKYKTISQKIKEMRMIKEKDEIEKIKKSAEIVSNSLKNLDFDKKEIELAGEIEYRMKINNSLKPAFDTIVISKEKTSFPHALPEDRKIEDILLVDCGAVFEGYCSDITRTYILKEDSEMKKIYRLVYEAKCLVEDNLKEGVSTKYLTELVNNYFGNYKKYFIHSLGHGVGLEVHELPNFREDFKLKENMVITIEPGLYIKNKFGVRIEDLYLIKKNGFKRLTKTKIEEY